MCADMWVDMRADMWVDMRVDMCLDMCAYKRADMRADMCGNTRVDTCVGKCGDTCMDMSICRSFVPPPYPTLFGNFDQSSLDGSTTSQPTTEYLELHI